MEGFEPIRQSSYKKYAAFNKFLANHNSYNVDIPNINDAYFRLGTCMFNILPVLSSVKKGKVAEVTIFDRTHPKGLNFPQVDEICSTMKISKTIKDFNNELFSFSYKLSAIVCDKVGGKAFLSATKGDYWIWFVVLSGANNSGEKYLQTTEKAQENVGPIETENWCALMNI